MQSPGCYYLQTERHYEHKPGAIAGASVLITMEAFPAIIAGFPGFAPGSFDAAPFVALCGQGNFDPAGDER